MENNTVTVEAKENVKALTTRFYKWDQRFMFANKLMDLVGLFYLHIKITTYQSSQLISSIDENRVFPFHPILFFYDKEAAKSFFIREVVPFLPPLSPMTIHILEKDIFEYLFSCFIVDPLRLLLVQSRRLPVIVTDIYLTREIGENVGHVGKRQKLSYLSNFEDVFYTVFENICIKLCLGLLKTNFHTRNLGLLRVCPLVKEKKARSTSEDPSCVICFCGYEKGELLLEGPCSHVFHRVCLLKWLPRTCPMCRRSCAREIKM